MTSRSPAILAQALVIPLALSVWSNVSAEEKSPWEAEIELGIINTTGNTESQTISSKAMGEYNVERWRHKANLESLVSSDTSGTSAERYLIAEKSDYKFTGDIAYVFTQVDYEADRFSGYNYRSTIALGYGRKLIKQDNLNLEAEIGGGYRQSEISTNSDISEETLSRAAANLKWKITSHSSFRESVSVDIGSDATITKSVTALKSQVNGNLATKLTYTVKNTSDVPVGIEKTDTETAFTLVYNF